MQVVTESFVARPFSATGNIMPTSGSLAGIFVSSGTGTVAVFDSATNTTDKPVVAPFTVVPGAFHPLPFEVSSGVYIVVTGTVVATAGVRRY